MEEEGGRSCHFSSSDHVLGRSTLMTVAAIVDPSQLCQGVHCEVFNKDLKKWVDIQVQFCAQDNEVSRKIKEFIEQLRDKDPSYYQMIHVVKQGEQPREGVLFLSKLVEDQVAGGSNYADWILQIHRQSQIP